MIKSINNSIIIKSLLLAPIPLLLILVSLFTTINKQFSISNLLFNFSFSIIIWLFYCILVVPISFVISTFLNKHKLLYLWVILLVTILITPLIIAALQLLFNHELSLNYWEKFFVSDDFIAMGTCAVFTSFCYWYFLKILTRKQAH